MYNQKNEVGNRPVVAGNESGLKLFGAYSIVNDLQNMGGIMINWFRLERKEPI